MGKSKLDKKAESVLASLLKQLEDKGARNAHFEKLAEDYVWLFRQVEIMKEDIKTRGVTYAATSSVGKEYEKDNPAAKNVILYSRQMLAILKELGLSTDDAARSADEDDDL